MIEILKNMKTEVYSKNDVTILQISVAFFTFKSLLFGKLIFAGRIRFSLLRAKEDSVFWSFFLILLAIVDNAKQACITCGRLFI